MDSVEVAWKVGAAVAFLLSVLANVFSHRSRKAVERGDPELRERVLHLERDNHHKDRTIVELQKRIESIEARANAAVTDEEFAAANQHLTDNVRTLTEKVGMLVGAVRGLE